MFLTVTLIENDKKIKINIDHIIKMQDNGKNFELHLSNNEIIKIKENETTLEQKIRMTRMGF